MINKDIMYNFSIKKKTYSRNEKSS